MAPYPSMAARAIFLVAFSAIDLEALVPSGEVLAQFGIAGDRVLLRDADGEIPDFAAFAARATTEGVPVVIAATREGRTTRALAAALDAPVIRVPVPLDGSPTAALSALTDAAGEEAGETIVGSTPGAFATVALGEAGAKNAALLAVSILALSDVRLRDAWQAFRDEQTKAVLSQPPPSG